MRGVVALDVGFTSPPIYGHVDLLLLIGSYIDHRRTSPCFERANQLQHHRAGTPAAFTPRETPEKNAYAAATAPTAPPTPFAALSGLTFLPSLLYRTLGGGARLRRPSRERTLSYR